MKLSCVILTLGDRPAELERAVRAVLDQEDVHIDVVVVGNGAEIPPLPDSVKTVQLPDNVGVPAGRNRGAAACSGDVILFLDDDGWYASPLVGRHVRDRFGADPELGVLSFRVCDPAGGPGARRHVPRLRAGDPHRSSAATTFLGGACAIRRAAFEAGGGLPERFFYSHEETDLAWRILDKGYRIEYDAGVVLLHPAVRPTRHPQFYRMNARNRVWLARRNLPWPLALVYLATWMVLTVLRERSPAALRQWFAGYREGWTSPAGGRRPISWRTVWRMTRAGRPPII